MLTLIALLAFAAPHAHASTPYTESAVGFLDLGRQIQQRLTLLNQRYDQLYQTIDDVQKGVDYRLALPRTMAEDEQKRFSKQELVVLRTLERLQAQSAKEIQSALRTSAPLDLDFETFAEGRMAGVRVPETIELWNGPSLRPAKPAKAELGQGTLGTAVRELCFYDPAAPTSAMGLFMSLHDKNMSCMIRPDNAKLLPQPVEALNEKIELLTGAKLDPAVIAKADPETPLDFTNAPELEALIMGYLEFKNDFSGNMMAQAIKYHAKRGTPVRIILPGLPIPGTNFIHAPDAKLLKELEEFSPNIKVQKYTFFEKNPDALTILGYLQRVYHAKAVVALSKTTPERSGVIVGGRNIKDTFYFKTAPDFSTHPDMIQYGKGAEPYIFFGDLEVLLKGREIAEQVASEILSFYQRDMMGPRMRQTSAHVPALELDDAARAAMVEKLRGTTMARFFFSAPFIDGHALEKLYVALINSAKTSIKLVNPYVVPPKSVGNALRDAARRGVRVDFVTTLNFSGDNSPGFTGDLNKLFFNMLRKLNLKDRVKNGKVGEIHVYEWNTTPRSIMHAKTMLIDDDVLYVGSANFDQRTLFQDTENGFLMTGEITREFKKLYADFYLNPENSIPVTSAQKVGLLSRFIKPVLDALDLPPPVEPGLVEPKPVGPKK